MTVLALLLFVGVAIWAWSPARKQRFVEAAQIPLQEEARIQRDHEAGNGAGSNQQEHES